MSVAFFEKIVDLEISIAQLGNGISSEQVRKFNDILVSYQREFLSLQRQELIYYYSKTQIGISDKSLRGYFEGAEYIQIKIIRLQKMLKNIFEPIESTQSTKSKLTDAAIIIDHPPDILNSLYKKRNFLIEQINLIESKSDLDAAEAETLHHHLSQLYKSFVKNQAVIENHVNGPALDDDLKISGEILQKVMSLQTKLKKIFASVVSPFLVGESHKIVYLNSLIEKQKSMMRDIKSMSTSPLSCSSKEILESEMTRLQNLKKWFFSNQLKIEELVDGYDLEKQKEISGEAEVEIAEVVKLHNFYSARYGIFPTY